LRVSKQFQSAISTPQFLYGIVVAEMMSDLITDLFIAQDVAQTVLVDFYNFPANFTAPRP
jgi:hypothetical protein